MKILPYDLRTKSVTQMLRSSHRNNETLTGANRGTIVCIHGILSSHSPCFDEVFRILGEDERFKNWDMCWYDYDYHRKMESNGLELAECLEGQFEPDDNVVLVCHSMGGLIARFAMLSRKMPFIKKVFLLGTPNLGAFRTHRLGLLAQLVLGGTRKIYGLFSQKPGILDLTRVPQIVRDFESRGLGSFANTVDIEYITIPGLYFDTDLSSWRFDWDLWRMAFIGLDLQLAVLSGLPLMGSTLERPHDGIVESSSNCMIPANKNVLDSEKAAPIVDKQHFPQSGYAHVIHRKACKDCTHIEIQRDERIISIIGDIIQSNNCYEWDKARPASHDIAVHHR